MVLWDGVVYCVVFWVKDGSCGGGVVDLYEEERVMLGGGDRRGNFFLFGSVCVREEGGVGFRGGGFGGGLESDGVVGGCGEDVFGGVVDFEGVDVGVVVVEFEGGFEFCLVWGVWVGVFLYVDWFVYVGWGDLSGGDEFGGFDVGGVIVVVGWGGGNEDFIWGILYFEEIVVVGWEDFFLVVGEVFVWLVVGGGGGSEGINRWNLIVMFEWGFEYGGY